MVEAEDRVTLLQELAERTSPAGPAVTIEAVAARLRHRRRRRVVGAVAVAAGLAAAAVLALAGGLNRGREGSLDLVAGTTSTDSVPTTEATAPSATTGPKPVGTPPVSSSAVAGATTVPLDVRGDVAMAWTGGGELVVWGGDLEAANVGLPGPDASYNDGAVFDPATGSWRPMAPGPLPASEATPQAAAVDGGVLIARGSAAAIWDPVGDQWREVDPAPGVVEDLVGAGSLALSHSANSVLDVATGRWRSIPDPPFDLQRPSAAWTGSELMVVGGPGTPFTRASAMALDPVAGRWRALPDPPGVRAEATSAAWDGSRVVVVNYDGAAAALDPATGAWTELAPVPVRSGEGYPAVESSPSATTVALLPGGLAVLNGDSWLPLPIDDVLAGIGHQLIADPRVDGRFWGWAIDRAGFNTLQPFDPLATFAQTARIQVGAATVVVPSTATLAEATSTKAGDVVTVLLDLVGGRCQMTSTYFGMFGDTTNREGWEAVTLGNDGRSTPWLRSPDGTRWSTQASSSDVVEIGCAAAADAVSLANASGFNYHEGRGDEAD